MSFEEVESYLYRRLPNFQNQGNDALNYKLDKIRDLCTEFGNPYKGFKSIHVAGTNGKGSVSHGVSSVLQESGYTVGLYTSPHIFSFTERIKINGDNVSEDWVANFVTKNKELIERSEASFFEITVLMAFVYFAEQNVDVAVVEVGLGGRFDSTNIITPEVSVITNIGLDHTEILGDTLEKIATEKAGIIKEGVPVVIGEKQKETTAVFEGKSKELGARMYWASEYPLKPSFKPFGALNDRTVKTICVALNDRGWDVSEEHINRGLTKVESNTGLIGRWEEIGEKPSVICDSGHNKEGFESLSTKLKSITPLTVVFGMVEGKDHKGVLSLLPRDASYIFCSPKNPRGLSGADLKRVADTLGLNSIFIEDVNEAIEYAKSEIQPQGTIFVGGSNFTIADLDSKNRN